MKEVTKKDADENGALYIRFNKKKVVRSTEHYKPCKCRTIHNLIVFDYDERGHIVGVEVVFNNEN